MRLDLSDHLTPRWQSSFQIKAFLRGDAQALICGRNSLLSTVSSWAELYCSLLASTVVLLTWAFLWGAAGLCYVAEMWTVPLLQVWTVPLNCNYWRVLNCLAGGAGASVKVCFRLRSNAPLPQPLLLAFHAPYRTSHKAYHQPGALKSKCNNWKVRQTGWTFYAQSTWTEGSYAVISRYLVLQKVYSEWKPGSFVTFLWLYTKTAESTGTDFNTKTCSCNSETL